MVSQIWLSFDLGIRGDYAGMYGFLDAHNAMECGDSVAAMKYEYDKDLTGELLKELQEAVQFDKRSRVYLIYKEDKYRGRYIVGKRKKAPWLGYAELGEQEVEEEEEEQNQ